MVPCQETKTKKNTAGGRKLWIRLDYSVLSSHAIPPARVWWGVAHLPMFPKTGLQQDEPLPYVAEVLYRGKYVGHHFINQTHE